MCGGGGCYLAGYVWLWLWLWPKVEVVVVGVVEFFWEWDILFYCSDYIILL